MTSQSVFVVDAGHTRIKCALCHVESPRAVVCQEFQAFDCPGDVDWNVLNTWEHPKLAILAGSNQSYVDVMESMWPIAWPKPDRLTDNASVPIEILIDEPSKVGVDRLLNGVAVNAFRQDGHSAVIVDSGTAVTVDFVDETGAFRGGAILPGLRLSARALHEYTTTLPHVDIGVLGPIAVEPIGLNTESAILSGIHFGHIGAVKELVRRMSGDKTDIVLTGGAAPLLRREFPSARLDRSLSLQGLAITALNMRPSDG